MPSPSRAPARARSGTGSCSPASRPPRTRRSPRTAACATWAAGPRRAADAPHTLAAAPARYARAMPYDEELANRLRELLADEDAITEKKMFGGLAFLLN